MTGPLGTRETLADVAATLAEFFRLKESWRTGHAFLNFKTQRARQIRLRK
jgi:phosphopentomutase